MKTNTLLEVQNLKARLTTREISLVDDVSFCLENGNTLAIVGESGSGKTTLCRAITRLFPMSMHAKITGAVYLREKNLVACTESELRKIRQQIIRYVFPEPQQALNPVATIRQQMKLAAPTTTESLLEESLCGVEIGNPHEVLNYYPHQLSIGMAQRVMLAMALLPNPALLIADEPTSSVDASLRYKLLNLLRSVQQKHHMSMIIITHDLDIARKYADHVAVLLNAQIVEMADCTSFFRGPQHSYSQFLLKALPSLPRRTFTEQGDAR